MTPFSLLSAAALLVTGLTIGGLTLSLFRSRDGARRRCAKDALGSVVFEIVQFISAYRSDAKSNSERLLKELCRQGIDLELVKIWKTVEKKKSWLLEERLQRFVRRLVLSIRTDDRFDGSSQVIRDLMNLRDALRYFDPAGKPHWKGSSDEFWVMWRMAVDREFRAILPAPLVCNAPDSPESASAVTA